MNVNAAVSVECRITYQHFWQKCCVDSDLWIRIVGISESEDHSDGDDDDYDYEEAEYATKDEPDEYDVNKVDTNEVTNKQ